MSTIKSVVISCAGIGSRLGLGQTKALIKINNRSIISWQLELLKEVEDLRIVIGYQANDVINEVLKHRKDVIFVYNHDYFNTKTAISFYLGAKDANEHVIEWDGDLLVHPEDVKTILKHEGEFVAYSDISSDEAVFVKTDKAGDVIGFSRKEGDYEWTGPACISKSKVDLIQGNVFEQIEPHLPIKGLKIRAYDIDTYEDYKRVENFVKNW
jgi:choline kinase